MFFSPIMLILGHFCSYLTDKKERETERERGNDMQQRSPFEIKPATAVTVRPRGIHWTRSATDVTFGSDFNLVHLDPGDRWFPFPLHVNSSWFIWITQVQVGSTGGKGEPTWCYGWLENKNLRVFWSLAVCTHELLQPACLRKHTRLTN